MQIRLVLTVAIATVAGFAAAVSWQSTVAGEKNGQVLTAQDSAQVESSLWDREHQYISVSNRKRSLEAQTSDLSSSTYLPVGKEQIPRGTRGRDSIKILALGDSYTFGHGVFDLQARWPGLLQTELDRQYGRGTFHVTVLAYDGSTTFDQADWLERVPGTYDFVIVGFVANDPLPDVNTPQFDGKPIPISMAEQHPSVRACWDQGDCDTMKSAAAEKRLPYRENVLGDSSLYPLWNLYKQAVAKIIKEAEPAEVIAVASPFTTVDLEQMQPWLKTFAEAGATVAQDTHVTEVLADTTIPPLEFRTLPPDPHPAPVLAMAYARDVLATIESNLDPKRIKLAQDTAATGAIPLVHNYLPNDLSVTTSASEAVISMPSGTFETTVDAQGQLSPCMALGKPYALVALDRLATQDRTIKLSHQAGTPVDVTVYGYDTGMQRTYRHVGQLAAGQEMLLEWADGAAALLLADSEMHCDMNGQTRIRPFEVTVYLQP